MPEQAYTPPENQNKWNVDEFEKALKRLKHSAESDGLFRMTGKEVESMGILDNETDYPFTNEQDYIIVANAKIIGDYLLFNDFFQNENIGIVFYDCVLPALFFLDSKFPDVYFLNCVMNDSFQWGKNCEVKKLIFWQVAFKGNLFVNEQSRIEHLSIENKASLKYLSLYEGVFVNEILISDCCKIEYLSIKDSVVKNLTIEIDCNIGDISFSSSTCNHFKLSTNCQILDLRISNKSRFKKVSIEEKSRCGDIFISSSIVEEEVSIFDNCKIYELHITEGSVLNEVSFDSNSESKDILINDSVVGGISLMNNTVCQDIRVATSQVGEFTLYDSKANHIEIEENCFSMEASNMQISLLEIENSIIESFYWGAGSKGEVYFSLCRINLLQILKTTLLRDTIVSVADTRIFCFIAGQIQVHGQLLLRNIKPLENPAPWTIFKSAIAYKNEKYNLSVERNAQLKKNLKSFNDSLNDDERKTVTMGLPLFRIIHSSMGKTEITGCNLAGFKFEYYNSKILDCFITGTHLPKTEIELFNPNLNKQLSENTIYEQKASIYNQLKKIFENQGDVVEASWYHAKAMENQQALLQIAYKEAPGGKIKKLFGEKGFDLFGFWLNKVSNNHGESWRRAICFVLLGSGIMYSLYYLSIHYHEPFGFGATGRFIGDYFSFLDITHRIDFHVPKEQLSGWSKFLDYFGKLVIGYGLYQLIAAFRRHGKKGG